MKKIGILTFHYSINEGAMLQAYALQEACRELFPGTRVEIVNYEPRAARQRDVRSCFKPPRAPAAVLSRIARFRRLSCFKQRYMALSGPAFTSDDCTEATRYIDARGYDTVIVGSDEVWKIPRKKSARGFPNAYWLNGAVRARKFSYAASANKTDWDGLTSDVRETVARTLGSFSGIAVRDQVTLGLVEQALPGTGGAVKVLDPTLLLGAFEHRPVETKLERRGFRFDRKAAVINVEDRAVASAAATHLRGMGWQVVCVTAWHDFADVNLVGDLDPLEWASVIRYCQFSVTDRFHGSIFSVLGGVPFVAVQKTDEATGAMTTKVENLLGDLGLEANLFCYRRQFFSRSALHERIGIALAREDYPRVLQRIDEERRQSRAYLGQIALTD